MKKLLILTSVIFFFQYFSGSTNETKSKLVDDLKLYYPGWGIKNPQEKISKVYLELGSPKTKELLKKYETTNRIIVCIDKNSDLYKNGIKLYDEILEVNGVDPSLYKYSSEPFTLKIKRGDYIFKTQKLRPVIFGEEDKICVPEFSEIICQKEFIIGKAGDIKNWRRAFDCCEKNGTFTFPFLESGKNFLKLDSLRWVIFDLNDEKRYAELNRYIKIAERELKAVDAVLKKFPDYELPNSYRELVSSISGTNLFNNDFKEEKKAEYDLDENLGRVKKIINDKINQNSKSLDNLKLVNSYVYYLKTEKQFDYLNKILIRLVADNYSETSQEYIFYIGGFYETIVSIYGEQHDSKNFLISVNDWEDWIKSKPKGSYVRVINARMENLKNTYAFTGDPNFIKKFITSEWKKTDAYINEFFTLSSEEQSEIIKIDKNYLYNGYSGIARYDNLLRFSEKSLGHYSLKALEEIKLRPQIGHEFKLYNYSSLLMAADKFNDDILLNKTLLDIKSFFIESKGKDRHLKSIKSNFPTLYTFYIRKGFLSELNDLVKNYDNLFSINIPQNLNSLSTIMDLAGIYHYYSAKSYLEKSKGNYLKSLEYLEKIVEIPYFDIGKILNDYNRDPKRIEPYRIQIITHTLPELYDGYYKTNNITKIREITKLGLNKEIENLEYNDLSSILVVSNPMRIFNPLLSYYFQNNNLEKIKVISKFISDNFDKITKENEYLAVEKTPDDFTFSTINLLKYNQRDLAYDLYEVANNMVLKKNNDVLYNSIWKYSNSDIRSAVQILEGANLLKSDDFFIKGFSTAQIIKNANTSRDILKGYLSKKNHNNSDITEYHNLQKDLISLTKMEELNLSRQSNQNLQDIFNKDFEIKKTRLDELERKIKDKNPEYFQLIKFEGVKLKDIQSKLKKNQAVIDYYFSDNKLAIVIIKNNSYNIHIEKISIDNLQNIKNNIRNTLQISKNGKLAPFDLKNSFKLNELVFLNIRKYLDNINYLFVVPHGPLNEIPIHTLPKNNGTSCTDCSNIEWNFSDYTFNYLASLDSFQDSGNDEFFAKILKENFKQVYNEFESNKDLKKIKDNTVSFLSNIFKSPEGSKNENILQTTSKIKYLGIGDPDLYAKNPKKDKPTESLNYEKLIALRSLNLNSDIRSINIQDFYSPLKSSREEIIFAAKTFGEDNSKVWLKENATETNLKETDLKNFNIIHFATHAEVSGAMKGLNEPFLVLSPPKEKSIKDNGLLMMNEIMQLNLNADLVILSACNTGSVEDEYSGSYSGLAKAFFVAGAKSVIVSNWYVEDAATQRLIQKFTENMFKDKGNFAENLNLTMKELSKQKSQYSHPIFWAPFVFVGTDLEINNKLN